MKRYQVHVAVEFVYEVEAEDETDARQYVAECYSDLRPVDVWSGPDVGKAREVRR